MTEVKHYNKVVPFGYLHNGTRFVTRYEDHSGTSFQSGVTDMDGSLVSPHYGFRSQYPDSLAGRDYINVRFDNVEYVDYHPNTTIYADTYAEFFVSYEDYERYQLDAKENSEIAKQRALDKEKDAAKGKREKELEKIRDDIKVAQANLKSAQEKLNAFSK